MKQTIITIVLCIVVLLFVGCTTIISGKYQNIPVTSDPNGATVTAGTGDSITTPGSFSLLRDQDHTLVAAYPGYEPLEQKLVHQREEWFWYELVPNKVHFKFIWLEPAEAETAKISDANVPGKVIVGYRVKEEETGKFVKIPVYGDEPNKAPPVAQPSLEQEEFTAFNAGLRRHTWDIGSEVYHFRYREPDVMEDNGVFYGVIAGYTYRGWVPASPEESFAEDKGLLRLEGRYACGQVDYNGSLTGGTHYTIDDIDDYVIETRLLLGIEELDKDWLASLYTGVGYRYLNDDTSFDPYGYERESNYLYVPLGYQLDGSFRDGWAWGGVIEADILVWGKQRSHLSDVGLYNVDNEQHKGYGFRASVRLRNRSKIGIILVEPFIRYWDIEDSEVKSGWIEPANNTTEFGLQLVWRF